MATAQDRLNGILPSWYELLTQWSLDGSLVAAATEALVLEGSNAKPDAKGQLQSLTSQWSAGNFKSLPQIVLLSNEDISGAQGAYAASTGTIYLNQDWFLTAGDEEIQRVLTEELGHSLDDQLNLVDTKGDEGALLSALLSGDKLSEVEQTTIQDEVDSIQISVAGVVLSAEASKYYGNGDNNVYQFIEGVNYYSVREGFDILEISGLSSEIQLQKGISGEYIVSNDLGSATLYEFEQLLFSNGEVILLDASPYDTTFLDNSGTWNYYLLDGGDRFLYEGGNDKVAGKGGVDSIRVEMSSSDCVLTNKGYGEYLLRTPNGDLTIFEAEFVHFNDLVVSLEASPFSSTLFDSTGDTTIFAFGDNDRILFEGGSDYYLGKEGRDRIVVNDYMRNSWLSRISDTEYFVDLTNGDITFAEIEEIEFTDFILDIESGVSIPKFTSYVLQSEFLSNGNLYAIVNAQNYSFPADDVVYKSPANAGASWMLAESYANQLGGNLATIDSSQENEVIRTFIESYAASNALVQSFSSYQDIGAWIGLYFDRTTGQWSWSSTGQAADYINFAPTDSNTNGGDSDYVAMYSVDSWAPQDPGQWNDHENGMSIGVVEIPYTQYQESAYVIVSGNTFEEARFNAQQLGGDLAILNSQAEFDFLVATYQGYQAQWQSLWLGLTDAAEEGKWLNVDGTLAGYSFNGEQNYLPWHLAEPNDFQGEDYGVLNWSEYWAGQFDIGRPGVMDPAALNDINNFTATGYDKPIYGIAEIKLPQPADIIGTATSDATPIIISGNLTAPSVESYSTTTSGRGKNKTTVGAFTEVTIDKSAPLDALVVNGGESNNTITGNGFVDNASTAIDETRSEFTGVLVIDGKGGADTITGGASGTNWLIGGGVTTGGTVDTLTGVALSTDIFDLRRNVGDVWEDAYSVGNAVINGYDLGDYIVLAKDSSQYQVAIQTQTIERLNKRGKVIGADTVNFFEIKDLAGDLIATVNGPSFTPSSSSADLKIVYGQNSQDPFEVVLPSAIPGTII